MVIYKAHVILTRAETPGPVAIIKAVLCIAACLVSQGLCMGGLVPDGGGGDQLWVVVMYQVAEGPPITERHCEIVHLGMRHRTPHISWHK